MTCLYVVCAPRVPGASGSQQRALLELELPTVMNLTSAVRHKAAELIPGPRVFCPEKNAWRMDKI